jgi:putative FmdB family regulatory protein
MPDHDFYCHACKKTFSKLLTPTEYEEGKIMCPHCGSRKVEQPVSPSYAVTSQKSRLPIGWLCFLARCEPRRRLGVVAVSLG